MSNNVKESIIDYVIRNFDFILVAEIMEKLDWKSVNSSQSNGIMSVAELRALATNLISDAYDHIHGSGTREYELERNMFRVIAWTDNAGEVDSVRLSFVLTDCSYYITN